MAADATPPATDPLDTAARTWAQRLHTGLTPRERADLRAWLAEPRHAAALARVAPARTPLDWPLHAGAMDDVLTRVRQRQARRRRRHRALAAIAALVLLAALPFRRATPPASSAATVTTSSLVVHAPAVRVLPDGSRVELHDGAEIETAFADNLRRVRLLRGTAHFAVQRDPDRPFLVQAGQVAVRAIGTSFAVESAAAEVTVVVSSGRVAVNHEDSAERASPPAPVLLDRGATVVLAADRPAAASTPPRVIELADEELARRLAWRVPRLEFSAAPLAEVIAAINAHNTCRFVLADPALADRVLSGVVRADNLDALVDLFVADLGIEVERQPDRIVLRAQRTP